MNPSIGDLVLYTLGNGDNAGDQRPAIIVRAQQNSAPELLVFTSAADQLGPPFHVTATEGPLRGQWQAPGATYDANLVEAAPPPADGGPTPDPTDQQPTAKANNNQNAR